MAGFNLLAREVPEILQGESAQTSKGTVRENVPGRVRTNLSNGLPRCRVLHFPDATDAGGVSFAGPSDIPDVDQGHRRHHDLAVSNLPRYGSRAGQLNPHFLDADLFIASFLGPLESYRDRIGTLFIEFSHFHPGDWERGREFVAHLDAFLERLPKGWDYSVEVRNESLLHPRYFEVLKSHNVAHTFNSWTRMPPVAEQLRIVGCETADFMSARFLLKPGRSYEQAVQAFQPYREIKEPNPEARDGLLQLLKPERFTGSRRRYIYVNNRLEGSAPMTIAAVLGISG